MGGAIKPVAEAFIAIIGGDVVSIFAGMIGLFDTTELLIGLLISDDVSFVLSSFGASFSQTFFTDSNLAFSSSVPELVEIGAGSRAFSAGHYKLQGN